MHVSVAASGLNQVTALATFRDKRIEPIAPLFEHGERDMIAFLRTLLSRLFLGSHIRSSYSAFADCDQRELPPLLARSA
jgi:hypothetical protein